MAEFDWNGGNPTNTGGRNGGIPALPVEGNHAISARIPPAEQRKRVRAARELRGYKSRPAFLADHEFPPDALKAIETGKRDLDGRDLSALVEQLDLPRQWFTEPLDELVGERPEPSLAARLDALEQKIEAVVGEAMNRLLERLPPANPASGQDKDAKEK